MLKMIHSNLLFDESLLDCHIKKQNNTVKEVELDEIDMEIINSSQQELTLLDKADLIKRIFDYPYREITNSQPVSTYQFIPPEVLQKQIASPVVREPLRESPKPEEKQSYQSIPVAVNDEKVVNKTVNNSYLTLKNKVLKNRSFRQNLINLKRRTQQLLSNGTNGDANVMDEEQFQSKVDAAIRNETEKGRVRCPFCPRRCFLKENMRAHLASSHNGDLPYTCNQCDSRFATKDQLVNHHRIHLEAKPFRCSLCDKGFTQLGNLQRHHKIHERARAAAAALAASGQSKASNNLTDRNSNFSTPNHRSSDNNTPINDSPCSVSSSSSSSSSVSNMSNYESNNNTNNDNDDSTSIKPPASPL